MQGRCWPCVSSLTIELQQRAHSLQVLPCGRELQYNLTFSSWNQKGFHRFEARCSSDKIGTGMRSLLQFTYHVPSRTPTRIVNNTGQFFSLHDAPWQEQFEFFKYGHCRVSFCQSFLAGAFRRSLPICEGSNSMVPFAACKNHAKSDSFKHKRPKQTESRLMKWALTIGKRFRGCNLNGNH